MLFLSMYARCGNVALPKRVFGEIQLSKPTITWTSIYGGCIGTTWHGMAKDALDLFDENAQAI